MASFDEVIDAIKTRNALHMESKNRPTFRSLILGTVIGVIISLVVVSIVALCFNVDFGSAKVASGGDEGNSPSSIGVILDDPVPYEQEDMMMAAQAAAQWIREKWPVRQFKIRQIRIPKSLPKNDQLSALKLLEIAKEDGIKVFVDLRIEHLSKTAIELIQRQLPDFKLIVPYPRAEYQEQSDDTRNSTRFGRRDGNSTVIAVSGTLRGRMAAVISKMKQSGSTLLLPIVSRKERHENAFEVFKREARKLIPEANLLPAVTFSSQSASSASNLHLKLEEVAGVCAKHPALSVLLFSDGDDAADLLSITFRKPEVTDRMWYYPEGLYWEHALTSREDASKVAMKVGMFSAAFLAVNQTGHFRHKHMMYLNEKLGKGSPLHATIAFDSVLVAFNALTSTARIQDAVSRLSGFKIDQGLTGSLVGVDTWGDRGPVGEYVRTMLLPELPKKRTPSTVGGDPGTAEIEVLHDSPWLPDGVVKVEEKDGDDRVTPVMRVTGGHGIKKSYLKKLYERSRALKCEESSVKIVAMDFLTHAKIERRYNATTFPDVVFLPSDHGFRIQLVCHNKGDVPRTPYSSAENDDRSTDEFDKQGDSLGVHFVCPPNDPIVRLPCIHSFTKGKSRANIPESVVYEEVPQEHMQKYFDAFGLLEKPSQLPGDALSSMHGSAEVREISLSAQKGLKRLKRQYHQRTAQKTAQFWEEESGPSQSQPREVHYQWNQEFPSASSDLDYEQGADSSEGRLGESTFQKRKSSIPGGYEYKKSDGRHRKPSLMTAGEVTSHPEGGVPTELHTEYQTESSISENQGDDQSRLQFYGFDSSRNGTEGYPTGSEHDYFGDAGFYSHLNIPHLDKILDEQLNKVNSSAFEELESWYPAVLAKLAETYGINEKEVLEVLKMSKGTYLPTIMRRDSAPVPAKPAPAKYPYPPYAKWLATSLPALGSCLGASLSCIFCTSFVEATQFVSYICTGACMVGIYGNCLSTLALLYSKVYTSNSVICTELFRQGRLDLPTYMADAQFGARLRIQDENVLDGYHALARPVVWTMQRSEAFSSLVHAAAKPWVQQMAYEEGYEPEANYFGGLMMKYGIPFCAHFSVLTKALCTNWSPILKAVGILGFFAILRNRQ